MKISVSDTYEKENAINKKYEFVFIHEFQTSYTLFKYTKTNKQTKAYQVCQS